MSVAKFQCPNCGRLDNLWVGITTQARLYQDWEHDNFETEVVGDHDWTGSMGCHDCGIVDLATAFQLPPEHIFPPLTGAEKSLVLWQFDRHGSFSENLWNAIGNADLSNRARLAKAYPELVEAYVKFATEEGYWSQVCARARQEGLIK